MSRLTMLVTVCLAVSSVQGQSVLYVDDDNCPGPGAGSLADPFCDLQDALVSAAFGDQIWVAEGTYKPDGPSGSRDATFQLLNGVAIYGGFPTGFGGGAFGSRDPSSFPTILSGDLNGDDSGEECSLPPSNCCQAHTSPGCDDEACERGTWTTTRIAKIAIALSMQPVRKTAPMAWTMTLMVI